MGKALLCLSLAMAPCLAQERAPLRILLDQGPITLNPRHALDAVGQRIGELLFRALVRLDTELKPVPDLASNWRTENGGKIWRFRITPGLKDHSNQPITPELLAACLENYRIGKPTSEFTRSFPNWRGTRSTRDSVLIELERPDAYILKNFSLLRYFRTPNAKTPCQEPGSDDPLIASGDYAVEPWIASPESFVTLTPKRLDLRPLRFDFVLDDTSKALRILNGDEDAVLNGLSLAKEEWLRKKYADRFEFIDRDGISIDYLTFNLRDPILSKIPVRQAIALSIDRELIVREKFFGHCKIANGFLNPIFPESWSSAYSYDPARAEQLLDQAGFPRQKDGTRFTLRFKSTSIREGIEKALLFREMLGKVGIRLVLEVVEPAVFFASIRTGKFQLFSTRFLGVSDGSIFYRVLHSGQSINRAHYQNAQIDRLLDEAIAELDSRKRKMKLDQVQKKMAEDLPYFPLWYWNNTLVLRKGIQPLQAEELSLSGSLEPLLKLR